MICGCGLLHSWKTPYKRLVYRVYTIFIMLLIHSFMLSQLVDLIMIVDNSNDFTDNFYVLLAMIVSCCKMFALLINRNNIVTLIETLMSKPFRPVEPDEMKIQQKFEKLIQSNTLHYFILVETTCLSVTVTSLLTEFRKGNLTFRAWLPFDYSSPLRFFLVYAHQLISFTIGSVHHVACDSLICGFLVHICCQIEILEHRLRKSAREPNILRECVLQHNHIFKFANVVNEKFKLTIFLQFVVSTLVMCFNLYQFTKSTALKTKYMQLILYTCSMLSQIFFYCWYGNEVKLRSRQLMNNVFEMEWFNLDGNAQKTLLMIVKRATIPIEFTSACVISMNLDSFVGLLKTSYSAYNILKQTMLLNRKNIATLTNILMEKPCKPLEPEEMQIYHKFDESVHFAIMVNAKFRFTIAVQFMVSTLVMCFNLYQFTRSTTSNAKYVQLILYMCSMLTQIFFYCWYGNEVKTKMRVLQLTFKILTITGCWRPQSCSSCMRIVYDTYTIFMIILLYTFLVSQFLDIIWNVNNAEDFAENFYATLASVVSCSKMLSLLVNRDNINTLTNVLIEKPYRPLEMDEMKIRYKFDRLIYINTLCYTILVETTCLCITMTSLFTMFRKGTLTYRAWLPYDYYSSTIVFCLTYAHQLISLTAGSLINVACDSLICGLLVHICCQIEILEYRLSKISNNHDILRDCVRHHDSIFEYAIKLNKKFRMTIAMQFVVSTLVVCSNLYQMTKSETLNANYLPLLLYMSCMLTQIFIYCWYGNEVKLKSTQLLQNIFSMDWITLDRHVKESLLIIMNRAAVPIEFTSAYILSMNLDSFVGILKTSYSAYNILKQV
ncbi:uncharacterized protein LOC105429287 [Pogonomyrmex barbatus]|uniref:Uncharacterized protein LOC105429287 n=1 Tax=Pogonomyrmex barbatus TaxID=144034 RepID=A0A6I9X7F3_9HYME|nr:uncharacterized protein LOC105429287 [Pogonomyrmex barbatus]